MKNKATGWLGALVRVTNLKFWFLRLRDKMLVFAGVVRKCLQHGHSFRLAGVWLKSENLRFAYAVTRFCSSRFQKKNIRNLWFSIIRIISGRHSLFQLFPLLDASGARALVATQKPQSATRQRCDAMSGCGPKCTFVCTLVFFCGASTEVAIFSSVSMFHPFVEYQQQWFYRIYPTNDLENDKS